MATGLDFNTPIAPPLRLRRFSVQQYHQLAELGVLTPDDKVELLEGWIVEQMNQRPIQGFIVGLLTELFQGKLPPGFIVRCQLPITTERSEPEPDIAIVLGSHANYRERHPSGSQCRLVIEVADTTLEKDRSKAAIYLSAGVQQYWIVNVVEKCIECYTFESGSMVPEPAIVPANSKASIIIGESVIEIDPQPLLG
jgi:Uma2 family endonuclease